MIAILTMEMHYQSEYVLDKMQMYEIRNAFKYSHYAIKDIWEANRLSAYMTAQVYSKKRLTVQDIVKFPWENENNNDEVDKPLTKQDIDRLKASANYYIKMRQEGKLKLTV